MVHDPDPPGPDALAAELALGVLDGPERAAARRRQLADPAFAAAVEAWQLRLAPLLDTVAEVEPPPTLWPRIQQALSPASDGAVHTLAKLRRWRVAALVSSGLAASLAALLVFQPATVPVPTAAPVAAPVMVAQIAPESGGPGLLAAWHADRGVVRINASPLETRGLAPELWLIPADGTPRSLGVIDPRRSHDVRVAPGHRTLMGSAATLAVSLEPAGGSPTGLPTGPVIASGKLTAI